MLGISRGGFSLLQRTYDNAVMCHGVAHWLAWYLSEAGPSPKYYSLDVSVETDLVSLTEISGPVHSHAKNGSMLPMLSVAADGSLAMFCPHKELDIWYVDMWTRRNKTNSGVWLHTKVVKLVPRQQEIRRCARLFRGEKGGTVLIVDDSWLVRWVDIENLIMKVEEFPGGIGVEAVPVYVARFVFVSAWLTSNT
jgi:hypothetical protein